jgi:amicyanin
MILSYWQQIFFRIVYALINANQMKTIKNFQTRTLIWIPIQIIALCLVISCTKPSNSTYNAPYTPPPSTPPVTPGKGSTSVSIASMAFSPATLTVSVGSTVTWSNNDAVAHTVTSDDGLFDSGSISSGDAYTGGGTYSYTFATAGTFNYHCTFHTMMTGKIIVQ